MRRVATTVRCVPRYGYGNTEVRTVDLDLAEDPDGDAVRAALDVWFAQRGIAEAVYDVHTDNDGFFAIVNDEIYDREWGTALL